jgi:hypothetical protein
MAASGRRSYLIWCDCSRPRRSRRRVTIGVDDFSSKLGYHMSKWIIALCALLAGCGGGSGNTYNQQLIDLTQASGCLYADLAPLLAEDLN